MSNYELDDISPNHASNESTTLSVEVPDANDDAGDQPQVVEEEEREDPNTVAPALQVEDKNEEERSQLGLNSPKAKSSPNKPPSNDLEGALTPNTLRTNMGINSPRIKNESSGWSAANEKSQNNEKNLTPADFITQVSRDDQSLAPKNDSQQHQTEQAEEKEANFGCFSCLFCCSSPRKKSGANQKQLNDAVRSSKQSELQPRNSSNKQGISPPKVATDTTNTKLLTNEDKIEEQEEQEEGEKTKDEDSETEYAVGLLSQPLPEHKGKKCLILDLDETLVHSSFKPITTADFIIPVEIDNVVHRVYVMKRPFVDEFLIECAKNYEVVIFTASLAKYADPLLDQLDLNHTITHRLFRESCVLYGTSYVKDLRKIGRKLKNTIIVDNSPQSYLFQPKNAIPIGSWFDDKTDTQLRDLLPCLNTTLKNTKDVRNILNADEKTYRWLCDQHD